MTAAAFSHGWFLTGDLATVNAEGYLNIVDRKKDVILTGGELVYSTEVEHVLAAHPAVLEAAVVGRARREARRERCTPWSYRAGLDATVGGRADRACRETLAHYKCPQWVNFWERLPRTGSGKVSKRTIREMIQYVS